MSKGGSLALLALLQAAPSALAGAPLLPPAFIDEAQVRGIDFVHSMEPLPVGAQQVLDRLPPAGAAAVAGDVNADGRDDLFLTSSARGTECALYLAGPDGRFRDATTAAGLGGLNDARGLATGAAFADVDTDGDLDLYVVRWGPDVLFLNRGDGTFERSPLAADAGNGAAAVFFDADSDGDPDLYVANLLPDVPILEVDRLDPPAVGPAGASNGGINRLYRNDGGRFVDVTQGSGAGDPGWSITAAAGDVDGDGDPDLLVGNVYGPLRLYRNQGGLKFAADPRFFHGSSMTLGIDLGDVNGDLRDDILLTGLGHPRGAVERSCLWLARDGGTLEEAGAAAGIGSVYRGSGARFVDLDLDGDLDLVFANGLDPRAGTFEELESRWVRLDSLGSANPLARFRAPGTEGSGRWCVAWNREGTFTLDREGGSLGGPGCTAALLDVGSDGRLDAYVSCHGARGALLVNALESPNHWIGFDLRRRNGSRAAEGARITVCGRQKNGSGQRDRRGRGPLAARGLNGSGGARSGAGGRLIFGLGESDLADAQIIWPSGRIEFYSSLPSDQVMALAEGDHPAAAESLRWAPADSLELPIFSFEHAIRIRPTDFELAAEYREFCLERQLYPRALRFFRELRGPLPVTLALHRLLAHADGVRRMEEGLLIRGASAAMALIEAGELIRAHPEFWTAYRLRALNYLYWPVEFDHLPRCVADYRRCIEIQTRAGMASNHHAQIFLELGDAHAKAGRIEDGIALWRRAKEQGLHDSKLAARLGLLRDEVSAYVSQERSLDHPPSTHIPWIEEEMSREPLRTERARVEGGTRAWNAAGPSGHEGLRSGLEAGAGLEAGSGLEASGDLAPGEPGTALLASASREPNNLVTRMLAGRSMLARAPDVVAAARGERAGAGADATLLARGWILLKGALTVEQVKAAHRALSSCAQQLAGREGEDPRYRRYLLLAQLGMGDAENLLGRLEPGYEAWRVRKDLYEEPVVARRVLIPIELIDQEVWSWSFGQGALDLDTLADLLR